MTENKEVPCEPLPILCLLSGFSPSDSAQFRYALEDHSTPPLDVHVWPTNVLGSTI
jgi:hypothetical protein